MSLHHCSGSRYVNTCRSMRERSGSLVDSPAPSKNPNAAAWPQLDQVPPLCMADREPIHRPFSATAYLHALAGPRFFCRGAMNNPGPPPTAWQQNGFAGPSAIGNIPARSSRKKEPSADPDTAAEAWKHVSRIAGSTHRHDLFDLLQNSPSDSQYSIPQPGVSVL